MTADQSYQDRPTQGAISGAWVDARQRRLMVVEMYLKDAGVWRRSVFTGGNVLEDGPSPVSRPSRPPRLPDRGDERLCEARQRPLWRGLGHDRPAGRDQQAPEQERPPAVDNADRGARPPGHRRRRRRRAPGGLTSGRRHPLRLGPRAEHRRVPGQHGDAAGGQGRDRAHGAEPRHARALQRGRQRSGASGPAAVRPHRARQPLWGHRGLGAADLSPVLGPREAVLARPAVHSRDG